MLDLTDRIELPRGVAVAPGGVSDAVRGESWPANDTAVFVLARAGRPLGDVAGELAGRFGLPAERARRDVLAFVWGLNRSLLLNIVPARGPLARAASWVVLAIRLAPAGVLPRSPARRSPLDTSSAWGALASAARATVRRGLAFVLVAVVLAAELAATAGAGGLLLPALGAVAVGAGLVLHEAGHAVALRGIPAALVLDGIRTYVLHRPLPGRRRALVAASGPCAAAAAGASLLAVAQLAGSAELAVASCPLGAHLLALTVLSGDGRTACAL